MNYAQQLHRTLLILDKNIDEFLKSGKESFITMKVGKTETQIPLTAESYCLIVDFAVADLCKHEAMYELYLRIKPLAEWQMNNPEEALITFKAVGVDIVNPFLSSSTICEVEPMQYYKEAFLRSKWLDELKIQELEAIVHGNG